MLHHFIWSDAFNKNKLVDGKWYKEDWIIQLMKNCLIRKLYGFDTGTTDDYNDEAYNFPSETLESKK